MRFLEFLKTINEDIPVGPLKNKELWLDYLKKNFKTPDGLFVTFVSVDKVGLNPKTPYDTPIGVYTYPLDYVLNEEDVPFRGETKSSKIKVLKNKTNKILSNDISDGEYVNKIKQIEKIVNESDKYHDDVKRGIKAYIKRWEQAARKNTNFGCLWNVTRMLSMDYYKNGSKQTSPNKNNPVAWTKLLLELGYDLAIDYDTGTIHPSEPTQAVFLNPNSYKVVGEEFVDTEERYNKTQKNSEDAKYILKNGWNKDRIDSMLKDKNYRHLKISTLNDIDALSYVIKHNSWEYFQKIVPYFKKEIQERFTEYFNTALSFLKPNQDQAKIVDYFISLNHPKMYSGEIPFRKLLKYMERTVTEFKNEDEIIKKLEKILDIDSDELEAALKDDKKVGTK